MIWSEETDRCASVLRSAIEGEEEDGRGVMIWGSLAADEVPSGSVADFLSTAPEGSEPAGVKGGEAMARRRGLPFGVWPTGVIGVGSLLESMDSSREWTWR
jgi:hypothetical protein